ncbi:hypothetical protein ACJU26_08890 [Acidithiobacillus sp. M4-SHS-6]|uniref:hypothetical protein n=1 Tax=Acidithiobacillus sp. M4-SHS-6 TaxID=3383024 RepID=UPI0039BE24C1
MRENRGGYSRRGASRNSENNDIHGGKRSTPTDKMLSYARSIADALDMDLPESVDGSFDACRDFIDQHAESVPPTDKQVKFATTLADDLGEDIPRRVLDSKILLSRWIDDHQEG